MIRVRPPQPGDFPAALALFKAACHQDRTRQVADSIFEQEFFSGPNGTPADESLVAVAQHEHRETVVGYVIWQPAGINPKLTVHGWVAPEHRGKGAGKALMGAVENRVRHMMQRSGMDEVTLVTRSYDDITGMVTLFRQQAFQQVRCYYAMSISLEHGLPVYPVPPGVVLDRFYIDDMGAVAEAENQFFAEHWEHKASTLQAWRYRMIETRHHDPKLWVIARDTTQDRRIVGICLNHASLYGGPQDGWVSVVGVDRSWRGRGLGAAVLGEGLRRLQQAGFKTSGLHVDSENVPAVKLYHRLGMGVTRSNLWFNKTIRLVENTVA